MFSLWKTYDLQQAHVIYGSDQTAQLSMLIQAFTSHIGYAIRQVFWLTAKLHLCLEDQKWQQKFLPSFIFFFFFLLF